MSRRRAVGVRVGRAAAMARVRMGARLDTALCVVALGLAQSSASCAQSHVVASSCDKYGSRMGVRPIRTPIISIRMGSGGSETLLVPPRKSRHKAFAKERPAATLHRGCARSSVAYRSAQRESTAIRAQRARRPGFKSRYDGRIRLGRPRASAMGNENTRRCFSQVCARAACLACGSPPPHACAPTCVNSTWLACAFHPHIRVLRWQGLRLAGNNTTAKNHLVLDVACALWALGSLNIGILEHIYWITIRSLTIGKIPSFLLQIHP
jgi:hypothetical protein